jgi:elongation factor P
MINFTDIKLGKIILVANQPHVVTYCYFSKVTKGKPTKKCKFKNLITGSNIDYTVKSGENFEEADYKKEKGTFMYNVGNDYSFMNSDTYETVELSSDAIGGKEGYLTEGMEVFIIYFNENPISVELPIKGSYKVVQTVEAAKGNTVSDVMKEATIETGMVVKVPAFIKEGEYIIMNIVEDECQGRDVDRKS